MYVKTVRWHYMTVLNSYLKLAFGTMLTVCSHTFML